jgi:hypothetical protein
VAFFDARSDVAFFESTPCAPARAARRSPVIEKVTVTSQIRVAEKVTVTHAFFGGIFLILLNFSLLCDIYLNMRQITACGMDAAVSQRKPQGLGGVLRSQPPTKKNSIEALFIRPPPPPVNYK